MHPLACWIDHTGELASLLLRGGGAGSNTAADLTAVLGEAIAQVPKAHRRRLLITCDAAGASHELIDWLVRQNHAADRCVEFSVGFDVRAATAGSDRSTRIGGILTRSRRQLARRHDSVTQRWCLPRSTSCTPTWKIPSSVEKI